MALSPRTVKTARQLLVAFGFTLYHSVQRFGNRLERLERLETGAPH
jgi:hypothetical protein